MTPTLGTLIAAAGAFLITHVGLSSTGLRGRLVGALGAVGFVVLYSAVAAVTLAWMAVAWRAAPVIVLWTAPLGVRLAVVIAMVIPCILVFAGLTVRNPTSVVADFTAPAGPGVPGIIRVTRHPMLWGVGLWAVGHLIANGDVAALVTFGSLALLAFGGTVLIDRKRAARGGEIWAALAAHTSNLPLKALIEGRTRVGLADIGWARIAGGVALYFVILFRHELMIGIWPLWGG